MAVIRPMRSDSHVCRPLAIIIHIHFYKRHACRATSRVAVQPGPVDILVKRVVFILYSTFIDLFKCTKIFSVPFYRYDNNNIVIGCSFSSFFFSFFWGGGLGGMRGNYQFLVGVRI